MNISALISHLSAFVTESRFAKMRAVAAQRTRYLTVVMEDIFQPHNANAVVRTAEIMGIQDLHVVENQHPFSVVNTVAMGSCKWLSIYRHKQMEQAAQKLKSEGYRLVATVPSANAVSLAELSVQAGKIALLFGTENTGLTQQTQALADECVMIPMYGFTQSFNVSVSVALCLQSIMERLRNSTIEWQLSKKDQEQIILDWLRNTIPSAQQLENRFWQSQ